MNNRFVLYALLLFSAPAFSQSDAYAPYLNPPSGDARPSPVIEAGHAIFGRVFGVQGSGAEIEHHVFDLTSRTPSHAAIRSALVPGWGQAFNRDKTKGLLFFVTVTATAVGSVIRYNQSRETYDDYKALGRKDSAVYDDYKDERLQAMVLGTVSLAFYVTGIIDAYRRAYQPLYSTQGSVDLAFSTTETQVVWSRRF